MIKKLKLFIKWWHNERLELHKRKYRYHEDYDKYLTNNWKEYIES